MAYMQPYLFITCDKSFTREYFIDTALADLKMKR